MFCFIFILFYLKIQSPVTYSDYVVPICVPSGDVNYTSASSWATGFGRLTEAGSNSRYLMQVQMPILSDQSCYDKYRAQTSTEICAGLSGCDLIFFCS